MTSERAVVALVGAPPSPQGEPAVATVRAVTGHDEEWLYALPLHSGEAATITGILARCVESLPDSGVDADAVRNLTTADRELLLLRVWALSLGDTTELMVTCSCGEVLTFDLALSDLAIRRPAVRNDYEVTGMGDAMLDWAPRLRLPTGADLERLYQERSSVDPADRLLAGCLKGWGAAQDRAGRSVVDSPQWPQLRSACAELLAEVLPGVEGEFEAICVGCGTPIPLALDVSRAFVSEMLDRRGEFDADVHRLALHYHWSPEAILALPRPRRRRYVTFLMNRLDEAGASGVTTGWVA